jgi:hypothetical protein
MLSTSYRNRLPIWHKFRLGGGGRVHHTLLHSTHISRPILSFAFKSSASCLQSGKAPYHSLPLPHLVYTYHWFFLGGNALTGRKVLKVWACVTTEPGQDTSTGLRAAATLMHVTGVIQYALQRHNTESSKQIFPEKELGGLCPNFHIHLSVSD